MLVLVLNGITKPFHHRDTENTEEKTKKPRGKWLPLAVSGKS